MGGRLPRVGGVKSKDQRLDKESRDHDDHALVGCLI